MSTKETFKYLTEKYNLPAEGSPIEIEGVGRLDFLRWIRELGFKVGAEVGVESGNFASLICDQNPQVKLFGVDPYLKYGEYREYRDQAEMDGIFEACKQKMTASMKHGKFEIVRKKSMDALADFEDESLDFVYIDGNHEGDFPYQDIKEWAKKVKKGGLVAGHDYVRVKVLNFTIKDALERYTKEEGIKTWFVLGRYRMMPRVVRDRTRSWCFVK